MQFAAGACGAVALGSLMRDPGTIVDPTGLRPITTEVGGVDVRQFIQMSSLKITDTLGQPVTASFVMINPDTAPVVGNTVRVFYHSQQIFGGTIDQVDKSSPDLTNYLYSVQCLDWSQTLIRRKLRRNFFDATIQTIIDSILDNELLGETLTVGTIDSRASIPLVDSRNAKVFDVCRDMAGATGQTFYVDFDQSIQMRSVTVDNAPLVLDEANVLLDGTTSHVDRDTYRNRQTVIVTGTPASAGIDALTSTQQRSNTDQIVARAAIEGGSGIYEEIEDVTHPTSNDAAQLALLGIGYARLRLASSGTPRVTVRVPVQGYGFRAGQLATLDLPTFGLTGLYILQRVTLTEKDGVRLFHDLEVVSSSLQQRAYESWLSIVKSGKVTVQMPGSLTNNVQRYATPGTYFWVVPAGVTTVTLTTKGPSGGGGGGARAQITTYGAEGLIIRTGGTGGNSGLAITTIDVVAGITLTVVVGAAGLAGNFGSAVDVYPVTQAGGSDGTAGSPASSVTVDAVVVCQADAGGGASPAFAIVDYAFTNVGGFNGVDGSFGGGIGDAVSVGGGNLGGAGGIGTGAASPGTDGIVEISW